MSEVKLGSECPTCHRCIKSIDNVYMVRVDEIEEFKWEEDLKHISGIHATICHQFCHCNDSFEVNITTGQSDMEYTNSKPVPQRVINALIQTSNSDKDFQCDYNNYIWTVNSRWTDRKSQHKKVNLKCKPNDESIWKLFQDKMFEQSKQLLAIQGKLVQPQELLNILECTGYTSHFALIQKNSDDDKIFYQTLNEHQHMGPFANILKELYTLRKLHISCFLDGK